MQLTYSINQTLLTKAQVRGLKADKRERLLAKMRLAMLVHGIDLKSWRGGIVSSAHTQADIDLTLEAVGTRRGSSEAVLSPAARRSAEFLPTCARRGLRMETALRYEDTIEIRAQVTGLLERQLFADGARVKKGDVLYVID